MNDWTDDIEAVLVKIKLNSNILEQEHKKEYFKCKNSLKYYRIPIIIISGVNSVISVGTQRYISQNYVSLISCGLALICSIIGSIELYLGIQKRMECELAASKDYYLLSTDITKTLILSRDKRPLPSKEYLDKSYNIYVKLYENSQMLNMRKLRAGFDISVGS